MSRIQSREQLANLINKFEVETYQVQSQPGRTIMNTIIYNKPKDKFYKIEWGEIEDDDKVNFLWYNPEIVEVLFNPKGHMGWFTKRQARKLYRKGGVDVNLENVLLNVESNIVRVQGINNNEVDTLGVVGAKTGKGKTYYAIMRSLEALIRKENVIFFSTECKKDEIYRRFINVLTNTRIGNHIHPELERKPYEEREKIAVEFLENSNLKVIDNELMNTNFIISTMNLLVPINKKHTTFVAIDHLRMSCEKDCDNTKQIEKILDILEETANRLSCTILVTTQLKEDLI